MLCGGSDPSEARGEVPIGRYTDTQPHKFFLIKYFSPKVLGHTPGEVSKKGLWFIGLIPGGYKKEKPPIGDLSRVQNRTMRKVPIS